jgi:hypothetical protein
VIVALLVVAFMFFIGWSFLVGWRDGAEKSEATR